MSLIYTNIKKKFWTQKSETLTIGLPLNLWNRQRKKNKIKQFLHLKMFIKTNVNDFGRDRFLAPDPINFYEFFFLFRSKFHCLLTENRVSPKMIINA